MSTAFEVDWTQLLTPTAPLAETVIRGTLMYLFLFFLFRALRREAGGLGMADLLLVVVVADAAQNGMAGSYESLTEGIVLVATIAFWSYALDALGYCFPRLRPLIDAPPLRIVLNGRPQLRNMRREFITHDELMSQLREHGIERLEEVREAFVEPDGKVSVLGYDKERSDNTKSQNK